MAGCPICERALSEARRVYQQRMVELREDYLETMQAIYEAHGAGEHEGESDVGVTGSVGFSGELSEVRGDIYMISGVIPVTFEVTRMSDDVYVVVLRLYTIDRFYREKRGKVYVGAEGSEQAPPGIAAALVQCAVVEAKYKEEE